MELYHDLYRLNTSITGWHVRVKILRIFQDSTIPSDKSLGLILVDEKGEKVEALVSKSFKDYYLEFLEEDRWYTIMKFRVFLNNGPRKLTKSLFKIAFLGDTIVKECELVNDCSYASFTPFTALVNGTIDPSYLFEMVGYVVKASELTNVDPLSKDINGYRISFTLKDKEGCHIKCEASGETAIDFSNGYKDLVYSNATVVCVLRWWKYIDPLIGSQVRVYSYPRVSKVLFNPNIPDVVQMLDLSENRFAGAGQDMMD